MHFDGVCLRGFHKFLLYERTVNTIDTIQINNKIYTGRMCSRSATSAFYIHSGTNDFDFINNNKKFLVSHRKMPDSYLLFLSIYQLIHRANAPMPNEIENERNQYWVPFWIIFRDLFEVVYFSLARIVYLYVDRVQSILYQWIISYKSVVCNKNRVDDCT